MPHNAFDDKSTLVEVMAEPMMTQIYHHMIQSLFLQWIVKLMGPSLFSFIILIGFFLG